MPPVDAVPLGGVDEASRGGVFQDKFALVTRAFAVRLEPEEAVEAWRAAYDDHYCFRPTASHEHGLASERSQVDVFVVAKRRAYPRTVRA